MLLAMTTVTSHPLEGAPPPQLRIGVAASTHPLTAELAQGVLAAAAEMGIAARSISPGQEQAGLDVLIAVGYQGALRDVLAAPMSCPRIVWAGESLLPAGDRSGGLLAAAARSRAMNLLRYPLGPLRHAPLPGPMARVRSAATGERERARNVRELRELARACRLVVTSRDRAAVLAGYGIASEAIPWGYSSATAGEPTSAAAQRDLPMLVLGSLDPRVGWRRSVTQEWAVQPGVTLADGVWGSERNRLLRRARVLINVQRVPGNFIGYRLVLALAAGVVVVTDPIADPYPFERGVHYVEAPLESLLEEARALIADEARRRRIVAAGQALLRDELSMARSLARVLRRADSTAGTT
jgi:hypothetical protein